MNRTQQIQYLIHVLLNEMPSYQEQAMAFPQDELSQRRLLRSLMNVRPPMPLDPSFLAVQDGLLSAEREEKGVVEADSIPDRPGHPGIAVWQGDITRLKADAIVDADNDRLLGCFVPCTAASTTPSTRRQGFSSGTSAAVSWSSRAARNPPGKRS